MSTYGKIASNIVTSLSRDIIGDKSWIYVYDPKAKRQSSPWKSPNSPRLKKARQVKSEVKSMLIFLPSKVLFTKNSSWQTKQSVLNTFYSDCMKMWILVTKELAEYLLFGPSM
jgi:hypothetical protein